MHMFFLVSVTISCLAISAGPFQTAWAQGTAQDANSYYKAATDLYTQKDYTGARDMFQKAVAANPNQWQSWVGLGNCHYQLKDNASALTAYQEGLRLNPGNAPVEQMVRNLQAQGVTPAPAAPAAAAPPAPGAAAPEAAPQAGAAPAGGEIAEAFVSKKLWTKLGLGYGIMKQKKLKDAGAGSVAMSVDDFVVEASVGEKGFAVEGEMGYLLNKSIGGALSIDLLFPGSLEINMEEAGIEVNQKISQMMLPVNANLYLFFPGKRGRFYVSAGGGLLYSVMGHDVSTNVDLGRDDSLSGIGPCVRGTLGHQFLLGKKNTIDLGVRALWAKVGKFKGVATLSDGTEIDGALLIDQDGLIFAGPVSLAGTDGNRYLETDLMDIDVRLSLTYHY